MHRYSLFSFSMLAVLMTLFHPFAYSQCGDCKFQTDRIVNGNFSTGNNGFTSDLNYVTGLFCPLCPENTYTVGTNAFFYHSGFLGTDHTNPPNGNFFIANAPGQAGAIVWCETLAVQPDVDYTFTFWARDITNNANIHPLALLQASFNGVIGNDTLVASGGWSSLSISWNSGSAISLVLCIVNQQSQTGGNDFGLDDISLIGCENYMLSQIANAGSDQSICSNVFAQLGQSTANGYTYGWDNSTGLNSNSTSNPMLQISNTSGASISQTYILTTDSAGVGCITTDTVEVTILSMPDFDLGENFSICAGMTTTLDAGVGWDSIAWATGQNSQTIECTSGSFYATVSYELCNATDSITISYIDLPVVNLGPDTSFCENDTLTLYSGIIGAWSDGSYSDQLPLHNTGEYFFTYTENNCSVSDTVEVEMFTYNEITITSDSIFCQGSSFFLQSSISGLWNTGDVSNEIVISTPGYYDIVTSNGPCVSSAGVNVTMILQPVSELPHSFSMCEDEQIELNAFFESNIYYLWSTDDTTSTITVDEPGAYFVEVGNACDTLHSEFTIDTYPCSWALFIPSSFTPNEDDINESWTVRGYNVTNVRVYVYNRLGDLIFHATDIDLPWTPGIGIGDDVYNYTVEALNFQGEEVTRHGHLYLLR